MKKGNNKSFLNKYKWVFAMIVIVIIMFITKKDLGINATLTTFSNIKSMIGILPPILILTGLLDVWISKEMMIKYMGPNSGIKGIFIALALGSFAAGPLYVAFPIAATLMKKEARFAYVLFFLGVWSSSKLPLLIFELTSFGGTFTIIHVMSNLIIFLIGAFIIEKIIGEANIKVLINR